MSKRVLFLGGTGEISAAAAQVVTARGDQLWVLNRGRTSKRATPAGVHRLQADLRDAAAVRSAIGDLEFDVVVNFFAFTTEHIEQDIDMFAGRIGHYVFISSASAYQKPPARPPVLESTPLRNPYWPYSRDKVACEELLNRAYRDSGFPMTIVRPSHTYDRTSMPFDGGWTVIDRMRRGAEIIVHGDGTSLWTITHADDFAPGLVGLLGHRHAIGDTFHITNENPITWDQIYRDLASAAGVEEPRLVHVASEAIAAAVPEWGPRLVGDVSHSAIFDNSKIRALVPDFAPRIPFHEGARQIIAWYEEHPEAQLVSAEDNRAFDWLAHQYRPRPLPSA